MMDFLSSYAFSAPVAVSHIVGFGLLFGLASGGLGAPKVVLFALVKELLSVLLWALVPDSLRGLSVVFELYAFIKVYERLTGPRVQVRPGAVFIADENAIQTIRSAGQLLTFTELPHSDGRFLVATDLAYAEYWHNFWGGPTGKWAIDIADVRTGDEGFEEAITKSLHSVGIKPSQCFNLGVGTELSVTCAAETTEIRDQWLEIFHRLLGNRTEQFKIACFKRLFDEFAVEGEGETQGINLDGMLSVLHTFGRTGDKPYVRELFHTFAKISATKSLDGDAILTKDTFGKFLELALKRPEIHQIYERFLNKKRREVSFSPQRLQEFLAEEQKEDVSLRQCKDWIRQWENIIPFTSLSSVGFTSFLLSDDQSVMDRSCQKVYQDMTQPLSHYFIATSHNTYLMKDQLKGKSSVEAYISAFKKGCKCVELDCWDGPNNEPIIYHGHTLTTKILFKDVIIAIRDHAFSTSRYPVILSFENHCSIEQQKVMANHLTSILGDMLYNKPIPEEETQLPSPKDLEGFVIVKAKKLKDDGAEDEEWDEESDSEDVEEKNEDQKVEEKTNQKDKDKKEEKEKEKEKEREKEKEKEKEKQKDKDKEKGSDKENEKGKEHVMENDTKPQEETKEIEKINGLHTKEDSKEQVNGDHNGDLEDPKSPQVEGLDRRGSSMSLSNKFTSFMRPESYKRKKKPPKIAQELSDLVFYCRAVHFVSFAHSKETSKHYEMSSFGEKKSARLAKEDPISFIDYNRRQFSRIYPAGSRVDSSNYDPQPLWNVGCQLVALNYQTPCKSMQLNQGLFSDNGLCGYVLKPEFMRQEDSTFDPRGPFDESKIRFLVIRVISGIQIPYTDEKKVRGDRSLLVQLQIRGVDADNQKEKTKVVKNNGYNPTWNDIIGFKLRVYELAMLTFSVKEGDNVLARYTLPVRCIQQGYRRVPLQSKYSETLAHSSLFIHVEFKGSN